MSNTPSDAAIEALAKQHLRAFAQFTGAGEVWFEGEVDFARAVLAKWGTPQPAPAPLSDDTALLDGLARLNWYVGPGDFYCDEAGGMNDYDDKNSGPEELRQAIRAAIAAQRTHHEQPICPPTRST